MKKKNWMFFLMLSAVFCTFSCKDSYTLCNLSKTVNLIAGFYRQSGGVDVPTPAPSFSLFLLNGSNAVYSNQPNTASFTLPLNPAVSTAKYVISESASQSDTLTIVYTSRDTNLSYDCGNVFYNNITALYTTTHTIDSVKIVRPAINTDQVENVRIYF